IDQPGIRMRLCFAQHAKNDFCIFGKFELVETSSKEAFETWAIRCARIKIETSFQKIHWNALFWCEGDQRFDLKADWELIVSPNTFPAATWANDFECANPAHHMSQVANENIARLYTLSGH